MFGTEPVRFSSSGRGKRWLVALPKFYPSFASLNQNSRFLDDIDVDRQPMEDVTSSHEIHKCSPAEPPSRERIEPHDAEGPDHGDGVQIHCLVGRFTAFVALHARESAERICSVCLLE